MPDDFKLDLSHLHSIKGCKVRLAGFRVALVKEIHELSTKVAYYKELIKIVDNSLESIKGGDINGN